MKRSMITSFVCLLLVTGFAQNTWFEYGGRFTPTVKKENLYQARLVTQIVPDFFHQLLLPYKDRLLLDQMLKVQSVIEFSQVDYNNVVEYVSVEITGTSNGDVYTGKGKGDLLTMEQQSILNTADLGTDIRIRVRFKYKTRPYNIACSGTSSEDIIEGFYIATVVPETEAKCPGGYKQITDYFTENVINKVSKTGTPDKLRDAVVQFTVNEEGKIIDAKIARTSSDPEIDKVLLDATNKMPRWIPAQNSAGIKVKQEFTIPFGMNGC